MTTKKAPVKAARKKAGRSRVVARQALLVLGMHRSGTSALTGVLAKLGAAPPRSPMPGNEFNERGYWESHELAILHDRILQSGGSRWSDWSRFNPDWFDSAEAAEFERHLEDTITAEYGEKPLFLVKDPRVSRFLPLWLRVLDRLQVKPKAVIPVRHPDEVGQSLARRDRFGRGKSRLLWLRHVLDAESATRGLQRAFVCYEDLLSDWRGQVRRMGEEIGVKWPRWSVEAEVEVDQFLSAELRHHRDAEPRSRESDELGQWAAEVHRVVAGFARGKAQDPAAFAILDDIHGELDRTTRIYGPVVREHEVAAEQDLARAKAQLEGRVQDEAQRVAALDAALAGMEQRAVRAETDAKNRAGRLFVLQNENDKHQSRILEQTERHAQREAELQARFASLQGEVESASRQIARLKADLEDAQSRLDDAAGRNQVLEASAAALAERHERDRLALEDASQALRSDREQLAIAGDALQARTQEVAHLRSRLEAREYELQSQASEKVRLAADLDDRYRELAAFARAMEATRIELGSAASRLRKEQARAAAAESRSQEADRQLAEARRERDGLAKRLSDATAELDRMRASRDLLSQAVAATGKRIEDQEEARSVLVTQLAATSRALHDARGELHRILGSNTWKLGRPLRVLRRVLAGGKVRGGVAPDLRDVERIRAAGVFDEAWYLERYPDVAISGVDPVQHYLRHGCDEGRDPSPAFSTSNYYRAHPEAAGQRNALLHFLEHGT